MTDEPRSEPNELSPEQAKLLIDAIEDVERVEAETQSVESSGG